MPKKRHIFNDKGVYMAKALRNAREVIARTHSPDVNKKGSQFRKNMAAGMRAKQKHTPGAYMSSRSIAKNKKHQRNMIKANHGGY